MNRRYAVDPGQIQNAVAKANEPLSIEAGLLTWCAVHGSLQMALRHPEFPPTTRQLVQSFVEQLGTTLVECGFFTGDTLREAMELEQRVHAQRLEQK